MDDIDRHEADQFDLGNMFSTWKLLTFPEVLVAARSPEPMRPINLEINPVNTCNQACHWCTYGYLHERGERLGEQQIRELLEDAAKLGVKSVTWTGGGEPTVYRPLANMIDIAAGFGFAQGINTNGSGLTDRLIEQFLRHFAYARFSVDAGSGEVYERTHRVPAREFDRTIGNIGRLVRQRAEGADRPTIGYSFLIDQSNVGDMTRAAELAKTLGVDYFQMKPIVHYECTNEQFDAEARMWDAIWAQLSGIFSLQSKSFRVLALGHKFRDIQRQSTDYGRTYEVCRGNELLATVGADGSVDLCCAYKGVSQWSFGNVNEKRFLEIWNGEQRRNILAKVDVKRCPPLCKAHEMNKLIHYANNFNAHREFI